MTPSFAKSILALPLLTVVTGCGTLVAPEGPQTNAFLNRVDANCGRLTIGSQPIDHLLDDNNNNDVYFIDETSKLAAGDIDGDIYRDDINAFYPTGDNKAALDCILGQLEGR